MHLPAAQVLSPSLRSGRVFPRLLRVNTPSVFSRHASTQAEGPPHPKRRSLVIAGFLGGSALIGGYFLWPDTSRAAPTHANQRLSPTHFTPVTVVASEPCSDGVTRLITLKAPLHLLPPKGDESVSPVWSVFIKDDDIQVERPYTPLEGVNEDGQMKFWIKQYPKGEVGRWIHSRRIGENIEIRGPMRTWDWKVNDWDEIIMISGGTGITPFCQLIHQTLLEHPETSTRTKFTLLHSSRTPGELPPPQLLQPLLACSQETPERLRVSLFVDSFDGSTSASVPSHNIHLGRIGKRHVQEALGIRDSGSSWWGWFGSRSSPRIDSVGRKILFLVCGPEPMIAAVAGPFGRNYSQGAVGGILAELGLSKGQVRKL